MTPAIIAAYTAIMLAAADSDRGGTHTTVEWTSSDSTALLVSLGVAAVVFGLLLWWAWRE